MIRGPVQNRRQRRRFAFAAALCLGLLGVSWSAPADEADVKPAPDQKAPDQKAPDKPAPAAIAPAFNVGTLIKVPLPLTGNNDSRVRDEIRRYLKKLPAKEDRKDAANLPDPRPILVLELSPGQSEFGIGTDPGKALDLARFLSSRELDDVRTVAYVPRTIKGHGVLLAMACQSLVMAPDAEIGEAGIDEKDAIDEFIRSGYTEIASRRNTIPPAVALGMLDKNLKVFKLVLGGTAGGGTKFVLEKDLADEEKKAQILSKTELRRPALFTGEEASPAGLGFASYFVLAKDRTAMAAALNLPLENVRERPSGEWRAKKINIREPINEKLIESVMHSLQEEIDNNNANFILLVIDTPGGSSGDVETLANYLAGRDPSKVQTVAYIPSQAPSEAAFIALACDHIVMQKGATIGGPGSKPLKDVDSADLSHGYRDRNNGIAKLKDRSWSLGAAMVDRDVQVFHYTRQGRDFYFSPDEVKEQDGGEAAFTQGEKITQPGVFLRLNSADAARYGVAETVTDYADLLKLYGLERDPPAVEPGWAITLIRALAHPKFAWLLLMIGGGAFLMELHAPGIGLGGFIAFLCFLIYFWGQHLNGTAGWLEVLLFTSGVVCLLIELFVIPGAAIFGLGGGLMILASLILTSQTFVISHSEMLEQLRDRLVMLAVAGAGIVGIGILSRRFLHRAPGFNRMLLQPPTDQEIEQLAQREALVDYSRLLGKPGVTATPLAPAGKARFDGELIDVLSHGEFIDRGTDVVVSDVQGNRVIVEKPEAKG